ncbi:hypothetical protein Tco_1403725 [Tanacetum coccineum]
MGCGLCLHGSPLIVGGGRGLVSCGYGSRLEIVVDSCVAFLVSQRASAEGIWATLLFIGGLEPCAFFLAKHFLTDVTFHQAVVSYFEIMCRVLGHQPSLGTFRRFYSSSINNGWLPFSKRASVPCCTSKPLDYLKGWNDHFFWIDASVCPIFIPWYNNVSVKKDPLPSDDIVDFELLEKLDNNCTMITKYPETLMCLVGFILSFSDPTARPTLICRDKSDTGLLDFVKSSDSSKIKTEERTFTPGEVPLLTETADMVVNPSPQTIRLVTHTIADEINAYFGKNKRKVGASAGPPPIKKARTGGANVDSEAVSSLAEEFVSSSITPTPKRDYEDESVSNHDDNLFCPSLPCKSMLILWLLSLWMKLMVRLFLGRRLGDRPFLRTRQGLPSAAPDQGSPVDDFYDSQTIDYATAQNIYVPNWDVTNNARMDDPIICRNLVDHVPPSGYWASLCNLSNADFLDRMNLNSAQHQRDAEVVELTSKLERAEGEAADVVSGLEFVRDGLKGNAVKLEFECECLWSQVEGEAKLKEQFVGMQDVVVQRLMDCTIRLAFMNCFQSIDYQTALGKAGRDLSMVEAYDPGVKARYEEAVGELENISLPFLHCLESYKDAPLDRVMASLYLEGFPSAEDETLDFCKLQPVP